MKIENDVLTVLSAALTDGSKLMLQGELDRALYTRVNKVLEASGGKWNRKEKAHVFDGDAAEAIETALLTGEFKRTKQDFGQFDTPQPIADLVVELAGVTSDAMIYEPSCGVGNLIGAAIRAGAKPANIFGNEIDQKRKNECMSRHFAAFGAGGIGCHDFLMVYPGDVLFDRVIMNPPFAKQADIDHVAHALRFVKPGGRLVAIMSASVTFRLDRKTQGLSRHAREGLQEPSLDRGSGGRIQGIRNDGACSNPGGERLMVDKYTHRRVDAAEFSALLNRASFTVDDFLYLTGRRRQQLERFFGGRSQEYVPTMAEVLILELAIAAQGTGLDDEWVITQMFEIVGKYDPGPPERNVPGKQCDEWPGCACGRGGPDNCNGGARK